MQGLPSPALLELKNIEAMYNGIVLAVKGISLAVRQGGCTALLGGNGAGKSTTLKAISGILLAENGEVNSGEIVFGGERISGVVADRIVRRGISHVMEGRRPLSHLTVEQNLVAGGSTLKSGAEARQRIEYVYQTIPRLADLRKRTAGYLSGGEQQMMVIGRGLMSKPKLMLLDEPSLGLAPKITEDIFALLATLRSDGLSLLIVEQNTRAALKIADTAYVMETGRIVMEGSAEEIASNEDVREFYLGLDKEGKRKSFREVKHYRRRKRWLG
ncbi:ABC transporter ATP-binding protein [Mesorhizobium microcysteis]|uniref:ABC transporter ATP-binding protein n=2 Tax=Neoaquamicrobium microcysteis TaxID=2682781 RepID=A0A5D4GYU2_9HYPH|nr:ABC transporter ATP-binding protein [Mesorhizobium microcysteis]